MFNSKYSSSVNWGVMATNILEPITEGLCKELEQGIMDKDKNISRVTIYQWKIFET